MARVNPPSMAVKSPSTDPLVEAFKDETYMRDFFGNYSFEGYWYLSYQEFVEIFGKVVDKRTVPQFQKFETEVHTEYHNIVYDSMMPFKWGPVLAKLCFNTG